MTVALLAVGVQGGHALGSLWHAEADRVTTVVVDARGDEPDPDAQADAERPIAWCTRPSTCFVDLEAVSRRPGTMPRGLRLVPADGGMRIDGARGLLTWLGLRNADVLLAIDDRPLVDGHDLDALAGAPARGGFSLRYRRGDTVHTKRIHFVPADAG